MNFDAYSTAYLQNMMQMCTQFEGEGVTDVRFIRQHLADAIRGRAHLHKKLSFAYSKKRRKLGSKVIVANKLCPLCGIHMVPVVNPEGLNIVGCKKCRYSEVV